jgi:hypothetical protein
LNIVFPRLTAQPLPMRAAVVVCLPLSLCVRRDELERHQDTRVVRVKHLQQATATKTEKKQKEKVLSALANSMLGSKLTRERSLRKYDRMIVKDRVKKEKEAAERQKVRNNTVFAVPLYAKSLNLPRQARTKHKGKLKTRVAFS